MKKAKTIDFYDINLYLSNKDYLKAVSKRINRLCWYYNLEIERILANETYVW